MDNEKLDAARENLLARPYRIIDVLPARTPDNFSAAYSALEKRLFRDPEKDMPYERFFGLMIKLACFCDIAVGLPEGGGWAKPEEPDLLYDAFAELAETRRSGLHFLLDGGKLLMTLDAGDLYMTVYGSSPRVLRRIRQLARSEGMFVWRRTK